MAFCVEDRAALDEWNQRLQSFRLPNSGYVERYYFGFLYTNVAPQILFELATDGLSFMGDNRMKRWEKIYHYHHSLNPSVKRLKN